MEVVEVEVENLVHKQLVQQVDLAVAVVEDQIYLVEPAIHLRQLQHKAVLAELLLQHLLLTLLILVVVAVEQLLLVQLVQIVVLVVMVEQEQQVQLMEHQPQEAVEVQVDHKLDLVVLQVLVVAVTQILVLLQKMETTIQVVAVEEIVQVMVAQVDQV